MVPKGWRLPKTAGYPLITYDMAKNIPEWGKPDSSGDGKSVSLKKFQGVDINEPPTPHTANTRFNSIAIKCLSYEGWSDEKTLKHLEMLNTKRAYPHTNDLKQYITNAKKYLENFKDDFKDGIYPITLDNLNDITNPKYADKLVTVRGVVSSNMIPYSVPFVNKAELLKKGLMVSSNMIPYRVPYKLKVKCINEDEGHITHDNEEDRTKIVTIRKKNNAFIC